MTITEWVVAIFGTIAAVCGFGFVGLVAWMVWGWWKAR